MILQLQIFPLDNGASQSSACHVPPLQPSARQCSPLVDIPPSILVYPAWQISSYLLSAECIPGAKCDWLDLHRLKLVVWWSEWHLMWFVVPHAVPRFFWFSATLPLHHPELCHPKGLQAPKTSYDPRRGRDMLNFAFGTRAHCLEISWNHHQRLPAHLFICFILVSSFQWCLPSFKSSPLENPVQWDVVLSFPCLRIEASWRLAMLQLLPAPACPDMACIWCIAFRNRMTLYPLVLSMVRSCHGNPNTSAASTSSQLDVNLPLIKSQTFDNLCTFCPQVLYSDFWVIYVCNPVAKILVGSHVITETLWLRCSWQLFTFADFAYYYVCTWRLWRLYRSQASHRVQQAHATHVFIWLKLRRHLLRVYSMDHGEGLECILYNWSEAPLPIGIHWWWTWKILHNWWYVFVLRNESILKPSCSLLP